MGEAPLLSPALFYLLIKKVLKYHIINLLLMSMKPSLLANFSFVEDHSNQYKIHFSSFTTLIFSEYIKGNMID